MWWCFPGRFRSYSGGSEKQTHLAGIECRRSIHSRPYADLDTSTRRAQPCHRGARRHHSSCQGCHRCGFCAVWIELRVHRSAPGRCFDWQASHESCDAVPGMALTSTCSPLVDRPELRGPRLEVRPLLALFNFLSRGIAILVIGGRCRKGLLLCSTVPRYRYTSSGFVPGRNNPDPASITSIIIFSELLVVFSGIGILGADVLPLASAVEVVPVLVHGTVEAHLESEAAGKDKAQHGPVLPEEQVVKGSTSHLGNSSRRDV